MTQFARTSAFGRATFLLAPVGLVLLTLSACQTGPNHGAAVQYTTPAGSNQSPLLGDPGGASAWVKQGVTDRQLRQDLETCNAYARAVQSHDRQVSQDINSGNSSTDLSARGLNFSAELRSYGEEQSYGWRLSECMRGRGYSRT
ncbi:hypothetical protein ACTL6U_19965 [Rhodovibrionaceae bacterium A322]